MVVRLMLPLWSWGLGECVLVEEEEVIYIGQGYRYALQTKTPSVLLYKTACREKVNYRGRRGMWWGIILQGWEGDGMVCMPVELSPIYQHQCWKAFPQFGVEHTSIARDSTTFFAH